jgi:hypothetical protein
MSWESKFYQPEGCFFNQHFEPTYVQVYQVSAKHVCKSKMRKQVQNNAKRQGNQQKQTELFKMFNETSTYVQTIGTCLFSQI